MSNGYVSVAGINDAAEFEDTVEAMNIMGLPEEEQSGECNTIPTPTVVIPEGRQNNFSVKFSSCRVLVNLE